MVDAGRKFYEPAWLAERIRQMADLKLNYLHLHLSDHQGFRIASSTHPEIVSEDHLTKRDVRRLLGLARRHHVTVVPEVDMPGPHDRGPGCASRAAARGGGRRPRRHQPGRRALRAGPRRGVHRPLPRPRSGIWAPTRCCPPRRWPLGGYPQLEAYARERYGPAANAKDAIHGFVNDMDDFVRARGRTARMWHDDIGGGSAVRRHADIVAEWWINASPLSEPIAPTPQALLDAGHRILNAGWFPTYVVNGVGGSSVKIRPDLTAAYEQWRVHDFYGLSAALPPDSVAAGRAAQSRRDRPPLERQPDAHHVDEDAAAIAPVLPVVAQQTWESPPLVERYADFAALVARVSRPSSA